MSKVQVDTIVDKDDISAPSLTKGAIVTGVCTATSFDGAISEWVLGADGTSHYTFTGSGLTGAENDPTLYLKRGQKYRFKNSSGGHPFRIQSTANGSAGTAYNDGVTNNDAGDGTTLEWDVQFDAPSVLYYQCTAHGSMGGKIYIGNSGNSSTLVDLNVSGVTTTGIATVTTSVVVGSAVTANADGVITAGVGTFGSVVSGAISGSTGTFTGDIDIAENIIHTGDTDTKIHFSAADQISFVTGGTTRVNITSGGNLEMPNDNDYIKIGAGQDLQLVHTGSSSNIVNTTGALQIQSDLIRFDNASGTERARISSTGDVGFGLTQDPPTGSFTVRLTETPEFNLYSTQHAQNNTCKINFGIGQSASVSGNTGARIEMNIPNAGGAMNGELKFHTNSGDDLQERLRITSAGKIHSKNAVQSGGNSTGGFQFNAVDTACVLGIQQPSSGADTNAAIQVWDGSSNNLRINYSGLIKTSAGIDFSGAQTNSGGMTSETLDGYEEGTWTPTNTIGLTLTNNNPAYYIKIGKLVMVQFDISFSGASDTAQCGLIQSLPFTSENTTDHFSQGPLPHISTNSNFDLDTSLDDLLLFIAPNEARIDIFSFGINTTAARSSLVGRRIRHQMIYKAA